MAIRKTWVLVACALGLVGLGIAAYAQYGMAIGAGTTLLPGYGYGSAISMPSLGGYGNLAYGGMYGSQDYSGQSRSAFNVQFGPYDIPRTSDSVTAQRESGSRIRIQWTGEPRAVQQITIDLLAKDGKTLQQSTVTRPPAGVTFKLTKGAAEYKIVVQYINGMTTMVTSPV